MPDLTSAIQVSNDYAPEHLLVQVREARAVLAHIRNAGSIFLGDWSPEPMGDYCSGTNHVLPTYGYARAYSGLSLTDFSKRITVQELSAAGLREHGSGGGDARAPGRPGCARGGVECRLAELERAT